MIFYPNPLPKPIFKPHEEVPHWNLLQRNLVQRSDGGNFTKNLDAWELRKEILTDAIITDFKPYYNYTGMNYAHDGRGLAWGTPPLPKHMEAKWDSAEELYHELKQTGREYWRFRREAIEHLQTYLDTQRRELGLSRDVPEALHYRPTLSRFLLKFRTR